MNTQALAEATLPELDSPEPAVVVESKKRSKSPAERIYDSMREQIRAVFPDDDEEAWSWTAEDFEVVPIEKPDDDYNDWLAERFEESDEFSKLFTRRMFMVWQELEENGFVVNDDELWEHQKALFAWAAMNICTGSREEVANLLIRSPYGSGKSKVGGLVAKAFRDAQLDLMLLQGVDPKKIPTGALIFRRKEHMEQNAAGEQYSVLEYENLERRDMNQYWKDLAAMFGDHFTSLFTQPKKSDDPFYSLFKRDTEDDEESVSASTRTGRYLQKVGRSIGKNTAKKREMFSTIEQLIDGDVVLVPNEENVPVAQPSQLREHVTNGDDTQTGFRGDSAHALVEGNRYRVKTSHKRLAPDRSMYTTKPNEEDPAQFAVVHGSALTRAPENIRRDLRAEIAKRCRLLLLDEAGRLNPGTVGDSISELSGRWPIQVGLTGQDTGVRGWQRSPSISEAKMIELGLMKPIAYAGIGDPEDPPSPGSEEAWNDYEKALFEDYETAEALGVEQPHEMDTVTVLRASRVHEYATRIRKAHEKRKIPVEVFVYHTDAGDRKSEVLKAYKAPKQDGDPRRVLVAAETLIAESLTIPNAHCYDIADNVSRFNLDQIRGRLGHVRNQAGTKRERANARTYIRQQWLHKGPDPYIREVAKKQGYDVQEEDAEWKPLQVMIDKSGYEKDAKRRNISASELIPDTPKARRRKQRAKGPMQAFVGKVLSFINPHAKQKEQKRLASQAKRLEARGQVQTLASQHSQTPTRSVNSKPPGSNGPLIKTKEYTAGSRGEKITIAVDSTGAPTFSSLGRIVMDFQIHSLEASFRLGVRDKVNSGLRGKALAKAVLDVAKAKREVVERRRRN